MHNSHIGAPGCEDVWQACIGCDLFDQSKQAISLRRPTGLAYGATL